MIKIIYTPGDAVVELRDSNLTKFGVDGLRIPIRELDNVVDMLEHARWLADVHRRTREDEEA